MLITPYISQQPIDDFGSRFTKLQFSCVLAAATDTSLTIPGTAHVYKALIKTANYVDVWVALNAAAEAPAGAPFAATTSELIVERLCREVRAGDILHFFQTAGGAKVSVVLFAVGTNN